jgi:predicted ferric reductase
MRLRTWHAIFGLTAVSFALTLAEIPQETWLTPSALSLSLGVAAASLMGSAALLGSRWKWVEALFGGLDHVYQTHKWLGVWALSFASVHLVFPALLEAWDSQPIIELARGPTRLVRQLSFVGLMLIVLLALNRKIPYKVWRGWHKLSGPLFIIVVLHWLSFRSPIAIDEPAGFWLAGVSALGVAGSAYKLALYPFLANHAEYRVVAVSPGPSALHMELAPTGEPIAFSPGQFGFVRLKEEGLREPHPFTFAAGAQGGHVHFVIRSLGDFTRKLADEAAEGMHADLYGPYGHFERRPGRREIWIGGGVGVTPFIAWLSDEAARDFDKVSFFYFFTPGREFPSAEVLERLARQRGAQLIAVRSGPRSPEFTQRFADLVRLAGPGEVEVSFCGPKGLLAAVRAQMRRLGIPEGNLRYEYFELR